MGDVGKTKAEVAAQRVMERVRGCTVTPHVGRIQDRDNDFYDQFWVIILGLDSLEARRYMNSVACSFLGAPSMSPLQQVSATCCMCAEDDTLWHLLTSRCSIVTAGNLELFAEHAMLPIVTPEHASCLGQPTQVSALHTQSITQTGRSKTSQ